LEAKNKTQQEIETLIDLNITYKLLDNGKDAWKDVPILVADDKQRYTKPAKSSVRNNADEILEQQVQLINQDRRSFQSQGNQFQQETTKLELQPKEKDEEIVALRNDNQSLQGRNSIIQDQTKIHTSENNSLQSENQELKLQINSLEYQLKEKDNKISLLKNENRNHRTSSVQQIQQLETLNHEKSTLEQNKIQASIEMEQLAASNNTLLQNQQDMSIKMERLKVYNASLEQLLKSEQGATVSLNGEDKDLSTANQFIIEMMETQKTLLLAKTNEMELLRQNMERLEQENRALKQERIQDQINTQSTSRLNNSMVNPSSVGSNHDSDNDDAQNDINYDSELEGDDGEDNDINYDTPSEDDIECP
jgi:chromosome segregation ATPase